MGSFLDQREKTLWCGKYHFFGRKPIQLAPCILTYPIFSKREIDPTLSSSMYTWGVIPRVAIWYAKLLIQALAQPSPRHSGLVFKSPIAPYLEKNIILDLRIWLWMYVCKFYQVWCQGIVKATVSGVLKNLTSKISEVSDQNWSCPESVLLAVSALRSSNTPETVAFTIPWYQTWWNLHRYIHTFRVKL